MSARVVVSLNDSIVNEVELVKPATVIGRRPDCDVVIDHPAVSGRHAVLRLVDNTVFLEDLASTNGVRVNGLPCSRQVVRHLDLIEIGHHKIHFFDDSLLAGRVNDLEHTVSSDYERTSFLTGMENTAPAGMAVAEAEVLEPAATPVMASQAAPQRAPALPERELDATQIFVARAPTRDEPALRVASGPRAGDRIYLTETHNLVGMTGGESALVVRRGHTFFLGRFSGHEAPRLNGRQIGPGTHALSPGDTIEVGQTRYELIMPDTP